MEFEQLREDNRRADRHDYSPQEWLQRHEAICREAVTHGKAGIALVTPHLFARASDDRNLICAWDYVAARSGLTPGVDGLTLLTLRNDKYAHIRGLRDAIRRNDYKHSETKLILIRKKNGQGKRRIHVPTVIDRIVQRGLVQILQPLLDPQFHENSMGYRPKRGPLLALASAESLIAEGRTVVITEDLKNAFECVPQDRLIDILRKHLDEPGIINLLERVVRSPGGIGIRQGGALSPLLLNVYLHQVLDRVWSRRFPSVPLLRYADDLALFCESAEQASTARTSLEKLITSAGFSFKAVEKSTTRELSKGEAVTWLGYWIRWTDDKLDVRISTRAWRALQARIDDIVTERDSGGSDDSDRTLQHVVTKWIDQIGPAYQLNRINRCIEKINIELAAVGWKKPIVVETFKQAWRYAYTRWRKLRREFRESKGLYED